MRLSGRPSSLIFAARAFAQGECSHPKNSLTSFPLASARLLGLVTRCESARVLEDVNGTSEWTDRLVTVPNSQSGWRAGPRCGGENDWTDWRLTRLI